MSLTSNIHTAEIKYYDCGRCGRSMPTYEICNCTVNRSIPESVENRVSIKMSLALDVLVFLSSFKPNDNYEPSADCNAGSALRIRLQEEMTGK